MKMKMKKFLSIGMAVAMTLSMVACGNKTEEKPDVGADQKMEEQKTSDNNATSSDDAQDSQTDITLWTYPIGSWGDSAAVDELIAGFNAKYPNIKVSVEYLDYTNGDDQVNTAIEGGQAPDIVMEGPERLVSNWGAKGLMVNLADLFDADADDIYENVVSACKADNGEYYEYPLCMVAHCMAINKNIFEKADALKYLDLENHTWTTEDFFKAVSAVYDSGHENVGAIYCAGQGGDQGTRALINNLYKGTFTSADHSQYTMNSKENAQALKELAAQKGIKFDASLVGGDEITLFRNGTLAMSFCWNASQQNDNTNADAGKTNAGDDIIPMQFPSTDGKAALCGGIWGFGIFDNKDEQKIKAAKTFIDFMANDSEQVVKSVRASKFFPVHKNVSDVYAGEDIADTMQMFNTHFMPQMGDYYQVAKGWATVRTEWWNMLQRIGSGGDVEKELATCNENANAAATAQ